jgi:hypothetical protein
MTDKQPADVTLRPWSADDLPLMERLLGDPGMTAHLADPSRRTRCVGDTSAT